MTEEMRNDLTPQGYIRQLFRETLNYTVDWSEENAAPLVWD